MWGKNYAIVVGYIDYYQIVNMSIIDIFSNVIWFSFCNCKIQVANNRSMTVLIYSNSNDRFSP